MTKIKIVLFLLVLVSVPTVVKAGIFTSLLSFDGIEDTMIDDSRGMAVNFDGALIGSPAVNLHPNAVANNLTVGDIIFGAIRINSVNPDGGGLALPPSITVLYSLEVTSSVGGVLQFGSVGTSAGALATNAPKLNRSTNPAAVNAAQSVGNADSTALNTRLSAETRADFELKSIATALGLNTAVLADSGWDKAAFILIESPTATDLANYNIPATNLNGDKMVRTPSLFGAGAGPAGANYSLQLVGGFEALNSHGFADFYEVQVINPVVANLAQLRNQGSGALFGTYSGGLSILYDTFPAGSNLLGVDVEHFDLSVTQHDVGIDNANLNGINKNLSSTSAADKEWMYTDKATFHLNVEAVPEPASMIVWAGMAGAFGLVAYRRRKVATK